MWRSIKRFWKSNFSVEGFLMLILIAILVIALLGLFGFLGKSSTCGFSEDPLKCRVRVIEQCIAEYEFTEDQCIRIVSGK